MLYSFGIMETHPLTNILGLVRSNNLTKRFAGKRQDLVVRSQGVCANNTAQIAPELSNVVCHQKMVVLVEP